MFYVSGVQAYHCRSNEKAGCICARVPWNDSRLLTAKMPWRKSKIWADNTDKNSRRHLHQAAAPSIALLLLRSLHFVVAPDNSSFFAPDVFLTILTYIPLSLISGNTGGFLVESVGWVSYWCGCNEKIGEQRVGRRSCSRSRTPLHADNSQTWLPHSKHLLHGAASQTGAGRTRGVWLRRSMKLRVGGCVWLWQGRGRYERKRSSKQIITPSHDYLRLSLWPLVPITWREQPVHTCTHTHSHCFSFSQAKCMLPTETQTICVHWRTSEATHSPFHCTQPWCGRGACLLQHPWLRLPPLIASRVADGHSRKTYSKLGRCWEVSGSISSISHVLLRVPELPSELQTQALFPSAPPILAVPFPTHPPSPDS